MENLTNNSPSQEELERIEEEARLAELNRKVKEAEEQKKKELVGKNLNLVLEEMRKNAGQKKEAGEQPEFVSQAPEIMEKIREKNIENKSTEKEVQNSFLNETMAKIRDHIKNLNQKKGE